MGLPAVRHDRETTRSGPRLALVETARRPARVREASRRTPAHDVRCAEVFAAFVVVAIALATLGFARVALSARAAALSIESARLREQIKAERYEGDMLEIQQSALATPTRIGTIAAATLSMKVADQTCYIAIDGQARCVPGSGGVESAATPAPTGGTRVASAGSAGLLGSIMHTAAGEAQALLLGDVGLASSR